MLETINVLKGPTIGDGMLFITINLVSFLICLILILRIGTGKLAIPVFFIGLGFLLSAIIPLLFGIEQLWLVPIIEGLFVLIGITLFMKILGVFELISKK
ncbi:MAG: hypothetical protein ABIB98_01615 [bacterium]